MKRNYSLAIYLVLGVLAAVAMGYQNDLLPKGQGDLMQRTEAWQHADIEVKRSIADALWRLVELKESEQPATATIELRVVEQPLDNQ